MFILGGSVPAVISAPIKTKKPAKKKRKIVWRKNRQFEQSPDDWIGVDDKNNDDEHLEPELPLLYFRRYLSLELMEEIAEKTNLYAAQKGTKKWKNTNSSEIEILLALHIVHGVLKYPRIRMYWETQLKIQMFTENMTRDRFFQLRNNLHAVDIETIDSGKDRLAKVRPMLNSIRNRCLQLPVEKEVCIDEQMVPFTGNLNIKQYMKGKPNPWGVKIFALCGKSGQLYDFFVYQGSTTEVPKEICENFGCAAGVVAYLSLRLNQHGHELYFDNYFSSFELFLHMSKRGIKAAGTVRLPRFGKPPLTNDKKLMKKGRGTSEEVLSPDGVVLVKWVDNRSVHTASNFVGVQPTDRVNRWCKKEKKYQEIDRPRIIKKYNEAMGGVDLLDRLISLYRITIKSKKWTLRMITHVLDLAATLAWLEYRKDAKKFNVKKPLDLAYFRIALAELLISYGKTPISRKRGRPAAASPSPQQPRPKSAKALEWRPSPGLQKDHVGHLPAFDDKKEATRCKNTNCKQRTHYYCKKCQVHLCLVKDRMCFTIFHE